MFFLSNNLFALFYTRTFTHTHAHYTRVRQSTRVTRRCIRCSLLSYSGGSTKSYCSYSHGTHSRFDCKARSSGFFCVFFCLIHPSSFSQLRSYDFTVVLVPFLNPALYAHVHSLILDRSITLPFTRIPFTPLHHFRHTRFPFFTVSLKLLFFDSAVDLLELSTSFDLLAYFIDDQQRIGLISFFAFSFTCSVSFFFFWHPGQLRLFARRYDSCVAIFLIG